MFPRFFLFFRRLLKSFLFLRDAYHKINRGKPDFENDFAQIAA